MTTNKTHINPQSKLFLIQAICLCVFIFPLFFQLSGQVFTEEGFNFDSKGSLLQLPIPIAAVTCFVAIALLVRIEKNHFGVGFIFSVFMLMMFSALMTTPMQNEQNIDKYILLVQFLLPMFGMVLGQLYLEPKNDYLKFEAVALYVLLLIIPLQVASMLSSGLAILAPSLFWFSLYQHLQYLPVIFVSLYFLAAISVFENKILRYLIIFLAPWVGVYVAASLSMATVALMLILLLISTVILITRRYIKSSLLWAVLLAGSFFLYYPNVQEEATYAEKFTTNSNLYGSGLARSEVVDDRLTMEEYAQYIKRTKEKYADHAVYRYLPNNIKERFIYWDYYSEGILENQTTFVFGHLERPHRDLYPSAHNYYMDLAYHFGVLSLLPFAYLFLQIVSKGIHLIWQKKMTGETLVLLTIVLFFILIDNMIKVSFRQPYPGMIMFFLLGKLITQYSSCQHIEHIK